MGVARLSITSFWFRGLVRSQARLLVEDGRYRRDATRDERMTVGEVDAAVHSAGIGRLEEVGAVVLETDGSLSVIRVSDQPLTTHDTVRR